MTEQEKQVILDKNYAEFSDTEPTYEQSLRTSKDMCGFAGNGVEGNDALRLIGLLCYLTRMYRSKDERVKPAQVLAKAIGKAYTPAEMKYYRQISLMCELFLTENATFYYSDCTTVDQSLAEIKRIMGEWLPF